MATLNTDIRYIKGVGEARAKSLAKLGITDLRSLLSYFPRAYDDRRAYKKIAGLIPGENACVCAVIVGEPRLSRIRKGLDLIKLRAVDETGALELTYFNQSYLKNTFHTGDAYVFFGRAEGTPSRPQMTNPLFEREGAHQITGRIMPIYPLTAGITSRVLAACIAQALDESGPSFLQRLEVADRVTLVAPDGSVLYDSAADAASLPNHLAREEIQQALECGEGRCSRYSETFLERTHYYALRLPDESVLRTACTQESIISMAILLLQPILWF